MCVISGFDERVLALFVAIFTVKDYTDTDELPTSMLGGVLWEGSGGVIMPSSIQRHVCFLLAF